MKINLKNKLNKEFDKHVPKLSDEVYQSKISLLTASAAESKCEISLFKRFACIAMSMLVLTLLAFVAHSDPDKPSVVTCLIVDVSPKVQLVIKDEKVVSIDALDNEADILVKKVPANSSVIGTIENIVTAAHHLDLFNSDEVVTIKAINNDADFAEKAADRVDCELAEFAEKFDVKVVSDSITFSEYNDIAFNGIDLVDDLDQDLEHVLVADEY